MSAREAPIGRIEASAYRIPTDCPEADGTIAWTSTTMILVEVTAGGHTGLGYTYADAAAAHLVRRVLAPLLLTREAHDLPECWHAMIRAVRNIGRPGIAAMAISAVDVALWDLKAKLLDVSLVDLLGRFRPAVEVYGSGGFTSYSREHLEGQLATWTEAGISKVKMKIGTHPDQDLARVRSARDAIGEEAQLFVDANGAYTRKQALGLANAFADLGVTWFEEPVSSDDLEGLRLLRDRAPGAMAIAAGEYGFDTPYFRRMLEAGAVDVLQADATRCMGITGFLQAAALCEAHMIPLSAHTAPSLHVHLGCALHSVCHLEYFHDHARIEHMLFEGAPTPRDGHLRPDASLAGLGLEFKREEAERVALGPPS